jgi:hypothetical protein
MAPIDNSGARKTDELKFIGGATTVRFAPVVPLHQTLELPVPRSAIALVFLSHSAWWTRMSTLREAVFDLTQMHAYRDARTG